MVELLTPKLSGAVAHGALKKLSDGGYRVRLERKVRRHQWRNQCRNGAIRAVIVDRERIHGLPRVSVSYVMRRSHIGWTPGVMNEENRMMDPNANHGLRRTPNGKDNRRNRPPEDGRILGIRAHDGDAPKWRLRPS